MEIIQGGDESPPWKCLILSLFGEMLVRLLGRRRAVEVPWGVATVFFFSGHHNGVLHALTL